MITFTVPGKAIGYYTAGKYPDWKRYKEYHAFCKKVCLYARAAGIATPMQASATRPLFFMVWPYFKNGAHCDPENVLKGVKDALFYGPKGFKGNDKQTGGGHPWPQYDADNPRIVIEIYEAHEIRLPEHRAGVRRDLFEVADAGKR